MDRQRKVLVGFKCSPSLKSALSNQAERLGITLSSHVETIMLTQGDLRNELSEEIKTLRERLAFYENSLLKDLYEQNKGKAIQFKDTAGKEVNLTINSITDVFTVIINSFKTQK